MKEGTEDEATTDLQGDCVHLYKDLGGLELGNNSLNQDEILEAVDLELP